MANYNSNINISNVSLIDSVNLIKTSTNQIYNGVEWLYNTCDSVYCYDFVVLYNKSSHFLINDTYDYFFYFYMYLGLIYSQFQLFISVINDIFINFNLLSSYFNDTWFKMFLFSKEYSLIIIHHPELFIIGQKFFVNNFLYNLTDISFVFVKNIEEESMLSPVYILPQLILTYFFILFFLNFYFSFFNSSVKEEVTIDYDYLASTTSAESEKEFSSVDDIVMVFGLPCALFGWFVYSNFWFSLLTIPEYNFIEILLPVFYIIILSMPLLLSYDFGLNFLTYVRGIAPSSIFLVEMVYDYISLMSFFVRLVVQGVRIILMLLVFISLQDLIMLSNWHNYLQQDNFWTELSSLNLSLSSISYYLLFSFPSKVLYWIYELGHTFFVITAQFFSFFAMVFWLFFFLYTFFVIEKFENYFTPLREKKQKLYINLYRLNNQSNF